MHASSPTDTYWVELGGGAVLAGPHPVIAAEGIEARVERLLKTGVTAFVDLSSHEDWMPPYLDLLGPGITYTRYEILDRHLPEDPARLHEVLHRTIGDAGRGVITYFHCQAGLGRTGTVMGCLLREIGLGPQEALDELIRLRSIAGLHPGSPEFERQREFVRTWSPSSRRFDRRQALSG